MNMITNTRSNRKMTDGYKENLKSGSRNLFGVVVFFLLEALVLIQADLANKTHFLTADQLQKQGIQGLPFIWHFGMWGDFIIISPIAAYIVSHYFNQWRLTTLSISFIGSLVSSALLGCFYTLSSMPEAHTMNHSLTLTGMVHLVYMFTAFTIFSEYFFFTPVIARVELAVISLLMFFHVFIGTHMALGIINEFIHFRWYPAQPLKSISGYLTIAVVSTALFWRNLQEKQTACEVKAIFERIAQIFMYWFEDDIYCEEKIKTPHGLLTFLDKVGDRVLEATIFCYAAWKIYHVNSGINALLPAILVLTFAVKFRLSRRSVKVELAIGERLFSSGKLPNDWSGPKEPLGITLSVLYFFVLYMVLAWFADEILIVSAVLFFIGCIDWNTRRMIHKNIKSYFEDESLTPQPEDKAAKTIEARRNVVKLYLFGKPHLVKEAACAAGCGVGLFIALISQHYEIQFLKNLAYIIMIFTLLTNEIITWQWRSARDRNLLNIERAKRGEGPALDTGGKGAGIRF
jgi:hypothetical protein